MWLKVVLLIRFVRIMESAWLIFEKRAVLCQVRKISLVCNHVLRVPYINTCITNFRVLAVSKRAAQFICSVHTCSNRMPLLVIYFANSSIGIKLIVSQHLWCFDGKPLSYSCSFGRNIDYWLKNTTLDNLIAFKGSWLFDAIRLLLSRCFSY